MRPRPAARVRGRRVVGALAAVVLGMSVGPGATTAHATDTKAGTSRMAADLLSQLRTHGLASASPYDRSAFLTYWAEQGGCNARDDVLRRDLVLGTGGRGSGGGSSGGQQDEQGGGGRSSAHGTMVRESRPGVPRNGGLGYSSAMVPLAS